MLYEKQTKNRSFSNLTAISHGSTKVVSEDEIVPQYKLKSTERNSEILNS
jgi:hypothetical protein